MQEEEGWEGGGTVRVVRRSLVVWDRAREACAGNRRVLRLMLSVNLVQEILS